MSVSLFSAIFHLTMLFLLVNADNSTDIIDPVTNQPATQSSATDGGNGGNLAQIIFGSVLILTGLLMAGFGWRGWKITTGLTGFTLFSFLSWIAFITSMPDTGYGNSDTDSSDLIVTLSTLSIGVLGTAFFAWRWNWGVFIIPPLGGMAFGVWLLLFKSGLLFGNNSTIKYLFIFLPSVILSVCQFWYRRLTVILGSATIGSFLFTVGMDCFIRSSFSTGVKSIFDLNIHHQKDLSNYQVDSITLYILLGFGVLGIGSIIIQILLYKGPFDRTGLSMLDTPISKLWLRNTKTRNKHKTLHVMAEKQITEYRYQSRKNLISLVAWENDNLGNSEFLVNPIYENDLPPIPQIPDQHASTIAMPIIPQEILLSHDVNNRSSLQSQYFGGESRPLTYVSRPVTQVVPTFPPRVITGPIPQEFPHYTADSNNIPFQEFTGQSIPIRQDSDTIPSRPSNSPHSKSQFSFPLRTNEFNNLDSRR